MNIQLPSLAHSTSRTLWSLCAACLVVGSVLAGLLIALISLAERLTLRAMGAQT